MPEAVYGPSESFLPMCMFLSSVTLLFLPSGDSLFLHPPNLPDLAIALTLQKGGRGDIIQFQRLDLKRPCSFFSPFGCSEIAVQGSLGEPLEVWSHVEENQDTSANSPGQLPDMYIKPKKTSQSPADVPTDCKCMNELSQYPIVQTPDITDEPCICFWPTESRANKELLFVASTFRGGLLGSDR